MATTTPGSTGYLGSLRALGGGLLAALRDRLQLLSLELHEEKFRVIQIFIWISAAVFTGMMAISFASLTLVYVFWESARLAVLGGLALLYIVAFVSIVIAFRRYLARQPKPFAATLSEIGDDLKSVTT